VSENWLRAAPAPPVSEMSMLTRTALSTNSIHSLIAYLLASHSATERWRGTLRRRTWAVHRRFSRSLNGSLATSWQPLARFVASDGDNVGVACPTCTRLERDEALLRDAVQEREETLRFDLPEDVRAEVEDEERLLATRRALEGKGGWPRHGRIGANHRRLGSTCQPLGLVSFPQFG
jgi:hypothetical protein